MTDAYSPLILIVDDAREIRDPLAGFLARQGFRTRTAANAAEARPMLDEGGANLAVIDVMMPGESGLSLCAHVSRTSRIPVILLSACADEADLIRGLDHGADDYVAKPFSPRELAARIRAVLRRVPAEQPSFPSERRRFDRFVHDPGRSLLTDEEGRSIDLTTGENRLLCTFLDHAGRTVSRARLLELMRGRSPRPYDRAVDNTVSRLRRKIGDDARSARVIVTEWGGGYRLVGAVETVA